MAIPSLPNEEFYALHNRAKTDYVTLRALLTDPVSLGLYNPHTFVLHNNQAFRRAANAVFAANRRMNLPPVHYSLTAHFAHLTETALNELHRFLTVEAKATEAQFNEGLDALTDAFKELEALNNEAWEKETASVDVVGTVNTLLANARSTVAVQELKPPL